MLSKKIQSLPKIKLTTRMTLTEGTLSVGSGPRTRQLTLKNLQPRIVPPLKYLEISENCETGVLTTSLLPTLVMKILNAGDHERGTFKGLRQQNF